MDQTKPGVIRDPHAKPTYRAINETYLICGLIDWRYAIFVSLPALLTGLHFRSKIIGLIAWIVFQVGAYLIYRKDPALPLIVMRTALDKPHICPFLKGK